MEGAVPTVNSDFDMGALLDRYLEESQRRRGDIIAGVVASVTDKSILIDVGGKSDAVVLPREVEQMTRSDLKALRSGQDVNVFIIDPHDDDGTMIVSLARAAQQSDWDRAIELLNSEEVVDLNVVDSNKGGVIVRLGRLRGFVPGSQLTSTHRPQHSQSNQDRRWDWLMGKSLSLKVIEVTPERNRLILSERVASISEHSKRKILQSLKVGSVHSGIVNNIVPFGAFVNVKGIDGLLHVSELSWKRVNDPHEIVQEGQKIDVYVLDVDLEKERLGLSLKRLNDDPWQAVNEFCNEGDIINVTVVNVTSFGAFAALQERPELEGLIHISELSNETVENPEAIVSVGDNLKVKVISLSPEERRIAFSLKALNAEE